MHIETRRFGVALLLLLLLAPGSLPLWPQEINVDIPWQRFVLDNGLTLIVHEDHKAPIVAVNVWYHVGSKNEKRGKTGFAHLFEHLMFNGSEHFNQDYFKVLEKIGATDLNGTTGNDRTNYFQTVPTSALDTVLWMESDRMGHLLGVIDQAKLDEQRGVVQNEKREGDNEPYGRVYDLIAENTYPAGHPYSWPVIGSMEDLNAASLKDVQEWFKTYYGPSNATIVIAGDVDTKVAKEKVEKYFGAIPPGPPVARQEIWVAKMRGTHRQILEDRVPQARIYRIWNIPQIYSQDGDYLSLVASVLGEGKTSRLFKRLVYEDQIATDVSVYTDLNEISGQFFIEATARPGENLDRVEKALDEELQKFLSDGPAADELQRVKTRYVANFLRGMEKVGGFGGKSDLLASGQVYTGNPGAYKVSLQRKGRATAQNLKQAANRWLSDGAFVIEVRPFPAYKTVPTSVDRSKVPQPGPQLELKFPTLQRTTLPNGLKVILAERHTIPIVDFNLLVNAGYASDQFAKPGTAKLAMTTLDEGTKIRNALRISEELDLLGAHLSSYSNVDLSIVSLSALKSKLDPSLEICADVVLNPSFPSQDFERERKQQLAAIDREKVEPFAMALRVLPELLYGEGHAYGNPLTGSGTAASVQSITREDLLKFHGTWFKPNNATLVVVGDTTLEEITPKLERVFQTWKEGDVPEKNIGSSGHQIQPAIYLVDRPGSIQSIIFAGELAPPKSSPDEIAFETLNTILGGAFISRVNMNLREEKHWSYGAFTGLFGARGERPFVAYVAVQGDKTKESMIELDKEFTEILSKRPPTGEELKMAQNNLTLSLPGSRETMSELGSAIINIVRYDLPDNYYETYPTKVRALDTRDLADAAKKLIHPEKLVWVIVGDRAKIEPEIKQLNFGEIRLIDADGKPVK